MAFFECNIHSDCLGMATTINVLMPQKSATQIGMDGSAAAPEGSPVLYLLHGCSDDQSIWMRRTSIERYAATCGIAVVMPFGARSFYNNTSDGSRWWDYISEELPAILPGFFNVSTKREDTFVAGLSMGGFGAFKLGILCPERFAAAASLSGMLDLNWAYPDKDSNEARSPQFGNIYGTRDEMLGSVNDIPFQMQKLIESGKEMPKFFISCGTEDFLYDINTAFRDRFADSIDLTYHEEPGTHEWGYWDRNIQRVLDWLPIEKKEVK